MGIIEDNQREFLNFPEASPIPPEIQHKQYDRTQSVRA